MAILLYFNLDDGIMYADESNQNIYSPFTSLKKKKAGTQSWIPQGKKQKNV